MRDPSTLLRPAALAVCATLPTAGCAADSDDSPAPWAERQAAEAEARLQASEGGRIVHRAIEAAGGLEAWYAAATSSYAWEYANTPADLQFKTRMVADNRTRRIYHDILTLGDLGEARPVEGRFAWTGEEAWIWPAEIDRINPRFWASTGYYFSSIPFVLADPGVTYESLPDAELDGEMYDMVRVGYEPGVGDASDTYTLYVDRENDRLRAIRYTVTFGGRPARGETLFYYDDYTTVDGLTVPTRFRGYQFADGLKGEFRNEAWVTEISFRAPFDESWLIMPEGGRVQPMP